MRARYHVIECQVARLEVHPAKTAVSTLPAVERFADVPRPPPGWNSGPHPGAHRRHLRASSDAPHASHVGSGSFTYPANGGSAPQPAQTIQPSRMAATAPASDAPHVRRVGASTKVQKLMLRAACALSHRSPIERQPARDAKPACVPGRQRPTAAGAVGRLRRRAPAHSGRSGFNLEGPGRSAGRAGKLTLMACAPPPGACLGRSAGLIVVRPAGRFTSTHDGDRLIAPPPSVFHFAGADRAMTRPTDHPQVQGIPERAVVGRRPAAG